MVKTTSIGHKKSKNLKTWFCRWRLSNYFLLVSSKSKIRIQRRFSFYFFSEIRRKEDEAAFRPFFLGNFQLISYPIVFNYVCCQFRDFCWNQRNNLEDQIRNFIFLGFVSNSNWIVIRNFQFLGFVPLLSWILVSYFV